MDRSDVINLCAVTKTQDDFGQWIETVHKTQIYCQVESISQSEFFEAGRNGLNPQYKFIVFFADYNDEPIVEYKDNTYAVYRTYLKKDDKLELYVERKGGTNDVELMPSV